MWHLPATVVTRLKASGRMKSTEVWDPCPVRWLVRDNGPKLQLISHSLPLA